MSTSEKCKELSQKKLKDDATSRERRSSSLLKKASSTNVNGAQSKQAKPPRTPGKTVKEPKNLKVRLILQYTTGELWLNYACHRLIFENENNTLDIAI